MSQAAPTTPGKTKALKALTIGAVLLAVIEGAASGTFSSLADRLGAALFPSQTASTTGTATGDDGSATSADGTGGTTPAGGVLELADAAISGPPATIARVHIGKAGAYLASAKEKQYNLATAVDPMDSRCIETVTVDGLQQGPATLYALGLPSGLSAAEGRPIQFAQDGSAHQQLVLLTATTVGEKLQLGATLVTGGTTRQLGSATATLIALRAGVATWSIGGQLVECKV